MEVRKVCFGKPHAEYRAQIVADGAVKQEAAYRKGQRLVVAFRKKRAGAHSGGNLRVRAFFISSFLSQE